MDVWRGVNDDNFPSLFLSNSVFTPTQLVIQNVTTPHLAPHAPQVRIHLSREHDGIFRSCLFVSFFFTRLIQRCAGGGEAGEHCKGS